MTYFSDDELLHPPAAERARRKAILYTWLLAVAFLVGGPAAYFVTNSFAISYTAVGSLWIEDSSRKGSNETSPTLAGGHLESIPWIELIRSRRVLEAVVLDHRLYIRFPEEHAHPFTSFTVAEQFAPGTYELRAGERGEGLVLMDGQGAVVQRGTVGSPLGQSLGFIWTPSPASFPPEATIEFALLSLEDAIENLSKSLTTAVDRRGSFLKVGLKGTDPAEVADVLNAVMERLVELAVELKNTKLEGSRGVLEGQLQAIESELDQAEWNLEEFRLRKSQASSDGSVPSGERTGEEERLRRRVQVIESLYTQMRRRAETAKLAAANSKPDVRILDRASVPDRPDKDSRVSIAMTIFLGFLASALGGGFLLDRLGAIKAARL